MLQIIREKSQGWFAWLIISALCLTFALWGIHSYFYGNAADQTAVKINGIKVSQMEVTRAYNQLKRQIIIRLGEQKALEIPTHILKKTALHALVSSIVMNQGAKDAGFEVGPGLLEYTIAHMPIFQKNGQFSRERFEQLLNNMLYTTQTFLAQLADKIVVNQIKYGILNTNFVLPNEVKRAHQLINQKRRFRYLIIPKSQFFKKIHITNQELQSYYKNHQKDFQIQEKVSVQYLRLSLKTLMKKIRPTLQQLKTYYQSNLSAYTLSKKWRVQVFRITLPVGVSQKELTKYEAKANALYKKLKNGEMSSSVKSTTHWMTLADLNPSMHHFLLSLKKKGDIFRPVKTATSYVIFKLIKIQKPKILPFTQVKEKVLQAYKQQKAQIKFDHLNDQLANITYESPHSLKPAADKLGLKIQETGLFIKNPKKPKGILKYSGVISAAFSEDVLNENNNSDPINLDSNDVIVLRVKKHIPVRLKPLSEVKASIRSKLLLQKASEAATKLGANLVTNMQKQPQKLNKIATQYHLHWKSMNFTTAENRQIDPQIMMLAFALPRTSTYEISLHGMALDNGDFAIVALNGIKLGSEQALNQTHQKILRKNLAMNLGQMDYQLYVAGLMKEAKIKYYNDNTEMQ